MALTRPRAYQIYDIDYKQATRVVTTTNITLAGGAPNTVDSISLALNDRVLVTGQSAAAENGIYYVTTLGTGSNGTWTRSIDTDATGELLAGTIVMVTEGAVYQDTQWKLTTNDPITIGVTALTFVQNYSTSSISAGTSNVVVASNSSVTISSAGTANVVKVDATNVSVTANIVPTANVTYSLGTATARFKDIYLANNSIYLGNLTLAGDSTQLTVNGANVVTSSGGAISTSGNITGGNLLTSGLISATGNINSFGAININSTDGNYNVLNISGTALAPYGSPQTWKFFTNNIALGGSSSFILFPDSSTQTTAYPGTSTTLSLSGNVTGGNLLATTTVSAASYIGSVVSVTANVTGGNVLTGGLISATGNVTSAANVSGGNLLATTTVSAASHIGSVVSVTANVTGGNILTAGQISATGTITTAAGTDSTGFAVGNGAVSNVGLGFFPTAGTRGDFAIRDYSTVFTTMYLDAGMGGTGGGEFQFRSSNAFSLLMRANSTGVYSSGVMSATGIVYGSELNATNSQTNEGGQINLALPSSGSTLSTSVIIDVYQNRLRFFEGGGTNRGAYIDLTAAAASAGTNLLSGGGGGTPGGSNTMVQFNDGGSFGGNGQFVYDKVTNTLTAGIIAANNNGAGTNFKVGDDIWIGDVNIADTMRLTGQQNGANAYIVFGNADGAQLGRAGTGPLTYAGAFSASGNVTGGNILSSGLISVTGNISAVGNVSGGNLIVTGNIVDTGALTITTGSNGNIGLAPNGTGIVTASGNISAVGNVTGGNLLTAGNTIITGRNLLVAGTYSQYSTANRGTIALNGSTDNMIEFNQLNSTRGYIAHSGNNFLINNFQSGNLEFYTNSFVRLTIASNGAMSATGNITSAANIAGGNANITTTINTTSVSASGNLRTAGTVSATGNINGGNLISAGTITTAGNIVSSAANATANIGSATTYFNTVHAKATSAQYADVAEKYTADQAYAPGTVIEFGGHNEVTQTTTSHSWRIAGVVSTNPAYIMNAGANGDYVVEVALLGRVPCRVIGPVAKGDRMVSSDIPGVAQSLNTDQYEPGCVIGKALEVWNQPGIGLIEVVVGRI